MQLDWTTFALEIVNFLVLVWLLKHFLYRPILATIERRKTAIQQAIDDATETKARADELERQYEDRLSAWEKEKEELRSAAQAEVAEERRRGLAAVRAEIDRESERQRAIARRQAEELQRRLEREATTKGTRFAARLLGRLATPALEERLVAMMLEDLGSLPPSRREAIADACRDAGGNIRVESAFPLPEAARQRLIDGLRAATGVSAEAEYAEDPELVAGLRVSMGPVVLHANVNDELAFFLEQAAHAS
jgi:F-type H+-transporting ATPase subunit b